jgi:hypothetical protein
MPYRSKALRAAATSIKAVLERPLGGSQWIVWRMTHNKGKAQA